jgi:acyl dehydratase
MVPSGPISRLEPGTLHRTSSRTVQSEDFGILCSLTWTTGSLHTDEEYGRLHTQFGQRILAGPVIFSLLCGLWHTSVAPILASQYGVERLVPRRYEVRYKHHVVAGDEIALESRVIQIDEGNDTEPGLLQLADRGFNQRDETIVEAERWLLYRQTQSQ